MLLHPGDPVCVHAGPHAGRKGTIVAVKKRNDAHRTYVVQPVADAAASRRSKALPRCDVRPVDATPDVAALHREDKGPLRANGVLLGGQVDQCPWCFQPPAGGPLCCVSHTARFCSRGCQVQAALAGHALMCSVRNFASLTGYSAFALGIASSDVELRDTAAALLAARPALVDGLSAVIGHLTVAGSTYRWAILVEQRAPHTLAKFADAYHLMHLCVVGASKMVPTQHEALTPETPPVRIGMLSVNGSAATLCAVHFVQSDAAQQRPLRVLDVSIERADVSPRGGRWDPAPDAAAMPSAALFPVPEVFHIALRADDAAEPQSRGDPMSSRFAFAGVDASPDPVRLGVLFEDEHGELHRVVGFDGEERVLAERARPGAPPPAVFDRATVARRRRPPDALQLIYSAPSRASPARVCECIRACVSVETCDLTVALEGWLGTDADLWRARELRSAQSDRLIYIQRTDANAPGFGLLQRFLESGSPSFGCASIGACASLSRYLCMYRGASCHCAHFDSPALVALSSRRFVASVDAARV